MNIPTTPIVFASQSTCAENEKTMKFTRRHGVLLIATFEILMSIAGVCIYGYATYVQPEWNHLVPVPQDLCNAKDIVRGVMFVFILLFSLEFFLAIYLLEGARQVSLGRLRAWLAAMLTYVALVTVVIIGMEFGGIRAATMNAAAFINIFIRFVEILIVYVYVERETMKRKTIHCNLSTSTITISTVASQQGVISGEPNAERSSSHNDVILAIDFPEGSPNSWRRL